MTAHPDRTQAPGNAPDRAAIRRVRRAVLGWYAEHRRDFPWRRTRDPYAVLVSEVMLQQTQADRVAPRFERFMARFPTAAAVAAAPASDVLAEWNGLGYNRRALNLRRAASAVAERGWPRDAAGLERLPGVGPYTARAVASLAFGQAAGVVDTNVRRWLIRRFDAPDLPRALQSLSDALAAPGRGDDVAAWTHATMELGASVCRPRQPRCVVCPIAEGCPSRGAPRAVAVPRQPALRDSTRAHRGAVVRLLTAEPGRGLPEAALRHVIASGASAGAGPDDAAWAGILASLERDGLAHTTGGIVWLGADTIGP